MLSDQDRLIVERDRSIPGLGFLLDPARMRELLISSGQCIDPGSLASAYLRYKPGMNCIARYEFTIDGNKHFAYAKAFGPDAGEKFAKAQERDTLPGPLGPGRIVLKPEGILFSVFPNDAKLRSITRLQEASERRSVLGRIFKNRRGWESAEITHLNYKPERRYVAKFSSGEGQHAVVKFYTRAGFERMRKFRKRFQPDPAVQIPEWIGGSKAHLAMAYSWQDGTTLRETNEHTMLNATHAAGLAIAGFHHSRQPGLRSADNAALAARPVSLGDELAFLNPQLATPAVDLAMRLARWQKEQSAEVVPVHGDFYDKQVVVSNDRVCLIDSDCMHLGAPLSDLGCFLAHLEKSAIYGQLSAQTAAAAAIALLEGYESSGSTIDTGSLNREVAFHLFMLIHQPFRDRRPEWPELTEALLSRSAGFFDRKQTAMGIPDHD
jgi:aminoglycoside phosphotransferase (APT) family kinase protein